MKQRILIAIPLLLLAALATWWFLLHDTTPIFNPAITISQNGADHVFAPGDHDIKLRQSPLYRQLLPPGLPAGG